MGKSKKRPRRSVGKKIKEPSAAATTLCLSSFKSLDEMPDYLSCLDPRDSPFFSRSWPCFGPPEMYRQRRIMLTWVKEFGSVLRPVPCDPATIKARKQLLKDHMRKGLVAYFNLDRDLFANIDFPTPEPTENVFVGRSFSKVVQEAMRPHAACVEGKDEKLCFNHRGRIEVISSVASSFVYQCNGCLKDIQVESHTLSEKQLHEEGLEKMRAKLGMEKLKMFLALVGVQYAGNLPGFTCRSTFFDFDPEPFAVKLETN